MVVITHNIQILPPTSLAPLISPATSAHGPRGEAVMDGMLQSHCVGIIEAIATLSSYANTVFSRVLGDSSDLSRRLSDIRHRCRRLHDDVDRAEQFYHRTTLDEILSNGRVEYHSAPSSSSLEAVQHFSPTTLPSDVREQYEKCRPPPNLALLDEFVEEGQHCMKMYTDPEYFLQEWIVKQKKIAEQAIEKRNERREKKVKRRAERVADGSQPAKRIATLVKDTYDSVTGKKIAGLHDEAPVPRKIKTATVPDTPKYFPSVLSLFDSPPSGVKPFGGLIPTVILPALDTNLLPPATPVSHEKMRTFFEAPMQKRAQGNTSPQFAYMEEDAPSQSSLSPTQASREDTSQLLQVVAHLEVPLLAPLNNEVAHVPSMGAPLPTPPPPALLVVSKEKGATQGAISNVGLRSVGGLQKPEVRDSRSALHEAIKKGGVMLKAPVLHASRPPLTKEAVPKRAPGAPRTAQEMLEYIREVMAPSDSSDSDDDDSDDDKWAF